MINKINTFHNVENFALEIVIFGNPCTMQFILNHFSNNCINVKKSNKKKNENLIYKLTGIKNYDAHKEQREQMFKLINKENYEIMKL